MIDTKDIIGRRVISNEFVGTIRYYGTLEGTNEGRYCVESIFPHFTLT